MKFVIYVRRLRRTEEQRYQLRGKEKRNTKKVALKTVKGKNRGAAIKQVRRRAEYIGGHKMQFLLV